VSPPPPTFADIVHGEKRAAIVHQDERHVAWLAERPARPGHVIVATRRVVDAVWDLPPDEHTALWACVQMLAQRLRDRLPCARVCVSVIGWVVRHAHVHLVPTDAPGQVPGLDGPPLEPERLTLLQRRLSAPESRDGNC
jgi:histidine triad (HIT) family protein